MELQGARGAGSEAAPPWKNLDRFPQGGGRLRGPRGSATVNGSRPTLRTSERASRVPRTDSEPPRRVTWEEGSKEAGLRHNANFQMTERCPHGGEGQPCDRRILQAAEQEQQKGLVPEGNTRVASPCLGARQPENSASHRAPSHKLGPWLWGLPRTSQGGPEQATRPAEPVGRAGPQLLPGGLGAALQTSHFWRFPNEGKSKHTTSNQPTARSAGLF